MNHLVNNRKRPDRHWRSEAGVNPLIMEERDRLDAEYQEAYRAIVNSHPDPKTRKYAVAALRGKYEQDIKDLHGRYQ